MKVKQHDYWMLLVSIGYTILIYIGHILVTLVVISMTISPVVLRLITHYSA